MATTILAGIVLALLLAVLAVQALLWRRMSAAGVDLGPLAARIESVERAQERAERGLREEIARSRQDVAESLKRTNDSLVQSVTAMSANQTAELARIADETTAKLNHVRSAVTEETARSRQEVAESLQRTSDALVQSVTAIRHGVTEEIARSRQDVAESLKRTNDSLVQSVTAMSANQTAELARMTEMTGQRLRGLQEENTAKLEQIRHTVDEQLQTTLEKRLGDSFKLVSERLEQVHRGLGEMQTLASGVGDLKKLLTNVRTRGTWGEAQLGMLLEQMLTAEQYALNVACTGTSERVEFAIKLPGPDRDGFIWLPVDAKFPREDYERLLDAVERADPAAVEASARDLEVRVRQCARDISAKYIAPPLTTDFAILYLPTEGLYAEVLRRPGFIETIQREHHVTIAGPTTLAALLSSLQMGFRTLAIQKRSCEVWEVLGKVKTEFGKYADVLTKVQRKLQEASHTVDEGLTRTRQIERKLKTVQELPAGGPAPLPLLAEEESELDAIAADIRG